MNQLKGGGGGQDFVKVSFSAHAKAFLVERQAVAVDVVLFMWVFVHKFFKRISYRTLVFGSSQESLRDFPSVSLSKQVQE